MAFFSALGREKYLILGLFVIFSAISAIGIYLIPGLYDSEAIVLIQPVGNLADPNSINLQAPPEIVRSQMEVVKSPPVIAHVVDALGLMTDAEFKPSRLIQNRNDADTRRAAILANVTKRLNVDNDGRSVTIHIDFEARSPQKAKRITNAIADEYIRVAADLKNRAVKATRDNLDGRQAELRIETLQAEQAAEDYRRSRRLIWLSPSTDGSDSLGVTTYASRLLDQFSRQAAEITATAAQTKAKASEAQRSLKYNSGISTPEILASGIVATLMQREAELSESEATMAARYTPKYAPLVRLREQQAKLRDTLNVLKGNITRSLDSQASSAAAADRAASTHARTLERIVDQQIADEAHYRQLQREAQTKRKTYESFAEQTSTISQRSLLQLPNAVLVSPATFPIKESWPNRILFYSAGCVVSLVLACLIALLRELRLSARKDEHERMAV